MLHLKTPHFFHRRFPVDMNQELDHRWLKQQAVPLSKSLESKVI